MTLHASENLKMADKEWLEVDPSSFPPFQGGTVPNPTVFHLTML